MSQPVRIVEVGPRDGLQNEGPSLSIDIRETLIRRLADAGLETIEAGALVSAQRIPQMAGSAQLLERLADDPRHRYPVLVPNLRGLDDALAAGAREIAVFGAASETFCLRNIHCGIDDSLRRFEAVVGRARQYRLRVRGYVSCIAGCPYEGSVAAGKVATVASALYDMGCEEISLGDTIGSGTPATILTVIEAVGRRIPLSRLAGHFHDTRGMALVNLYAALQAGLRTFDASVAGLGGCPYAPGAAGNVATEEVVYLLEAQGYRTGIDLTALVHTAWWICGQLGRRPQSRLSQAMINQTQQEATP